MAVNKARKRRMGFLGFLLAASAIVAAVSVLSTGFTLYGGAGLLVNGTMYGFDNESVLLSIASDICGAGAYASYNGSSFVCSVPSATADGNNYTTACSVYTSGATETISCARIGMNNFTYTITDDTGVATGDGYWPLPTSTWLYNNSNTIDLNTSKLTNSATIACNNITGNASNLCTITPTTDTNYYTSGISVDGSGTGSRTIQLSRNALANISATYVDMDYDNYTTGANVSGTTIKTLNLAQKNGSNITTTWVDLDTDTNNYVTAANVSGGAIKTLQIAISGLSNVSTSWIDYDTDVNGSGVADNNYSNGTVITGTTTKTINIARVGMTNLSASWTDIDTDTNNYDTAISYLGPILTLTRNGLSDLTATIPNNAITIACNNITGNASNLCTITPTTDTNYYTSGISVDGSGTGSRTIQLSRNALANISATYVDMDYDNYTTGANVSGTTIKTLNLAQKNGSNITTTWVDLDTDTNNYVTAANVSGTSIKTLNLALSGLSNVSTSWVDIDTDVNNYDTGISVDGSGTGSRTIQIARSGLANITATYVDMDYDNYSTGINVSGTTTKTINIGQHNGTNLSTAWIDDNNYLTGANVSGGAIKTLQLSLNGLANISTTWIDFDTDTNGTGGTSYANISGSGGAAYNFSAWTNASHIISAPLKWDTTGRVFYGTETVDTGYSADVMFEIARAASDVMLQINSDGGSMAGINLRSGTDDWVIQQNSTKYFGIYYEGTTEANTILTINPTTRDTTFRTGINTSSATVKSLALGNNQPCRVYAQATNGSLYCNGDIYNYTTTQYGNAVATWTNVGNLSALLSASSTYIVRCGLLGYASAATTGTLLRINTTGTPTAVRWSYDTAVSATTRTPFQGNSTSTNAFNDTGSGGINILDTDFVYGYIQTAGSVSAVTFEMQSEIGTAGTAHIEIGSSCEYTKVN
jgi:hypothetical protein